MRTKHLDRTKHFYVSDVKSEKNYISVLHNIVLALGAYFAFSFAACIEPQAISSSKEITSARIKPRSKSECILPAAWGAFGTFLYCPRSDLGFALR